MYFSINREMLRNELHRSTVASLPLDRLLTETDGPFAMVDGRDARPSDVATTVAELARARSMKQLELAEIVAGNLRRLVAELRPAQFRVKLILTLPPRSAEGEFRSTEKRIAKRQCSTCGLGSVRAGSRAMHSTI
jgi:hypothetical protein